MSPTDHARHRLVGALMASAERGVRAARREARASSGLADARTARLIEQRFQKLVRTRLPSAAIAERAVRAVADVAGDAETRAIALRIAAVLDHLDGRPGPAERRLEEAATLFRRLRRWLDAGDVHRVLVEVRMRWGNTGGAAWASRAARRLYDRGGGAGARRRGSLAMSEGNVHHRRDRHREALASYELARRCFVRAGESLRVAHAEFNRANILASLDRIEEARTLYERSLARYRADGLHALAAQTDAALAVLDLLEGRLDDGLDRLARVRVRQQAARDRIGIAHTDLDAADAFLRLNRPVEAERAARRAQSAFRRAGHDAEQALCLAVRGSAALSLGDARRAERRFAEAARLHRAARNTVGAALAEVGVAQAQLRRGSSRAALAVARRGAALFRRRGLRSREARALAIAAAAARNDGRDAIARAMATRAAELAEHCDDARVAMAAYLELGRLDAEAGDADSAFENFVRAERHVEAMRIGVTTEDSRLAFSADKGEVYEAIVENRLRRGGRKAVRQALLYAERGKARALAESLADGRLAALGAGTAAVANLVASLREVDRKMAVAEARSGERPPPRGMRSSPLRTLVSRRRATLRALTRRDPRTAALIGAPPDPWRAVRRLGADDVVVEYTQSRGRLHAFVIDRDGIEAYPDLCDIEEVRRASDLLRFQLGKGVLGQAHAARFGRFMHDALRHHLENLHGLLVAPFAGRITGKRVRFVPHGLLHGMPFHALESDGVPLVERCEISFAPSLAILGILERRESTSRGRPLVLGVPDDAAPAIEREIAALCGILDRARVFRGERATLSALRLAERRPEVLHVACHGFYGGGGHDGAALRLGDAWISLDDVYAMRGTAEIVVLSGCQTGRGTVYSGDEWVGLVRGFLRAGARTVVASLWEVHDASAVELMADFYRGLSRGLDAAAAMTLAQRAARRRDPLPLKWAPFMVIGEPTSRLRSGRMAA